jgi:hypothetical protein
MFDNKIPKQTLEESLRGRKPAGNPRNRWKNKLWKEAAILLNIKTGTQRHDTGVTVGRKQQRPWPGNRPKTQWIVCGYIILFF